MMQPGQLREGEKPEFLFRGPFGGVQVELPSHLIESIQGFNDCTNIIFMNGLATVRPGVNMITAFPAGGPSNEQINGIVDFYNAAGNLIQVVITAGSSGSGRLLEWEGPASGWNVITNAGTPLTGTNAAQFTYDSIGYKLAFGNGVDPVQIWDGIAATFTAATNGPIARYLCEIENQLMTGYVTASGMTFPQRFQWSGIGNPNDWTSFSSGISDQLNNFGAITGIIKLNQVAYGFQQKGILLILPTGIGTAPFQFYPFGSRARGNIAPLSLDVYNETLAFYLGNDNVYMFTGSACEPIGRQPLQGRSWQGAWSRISTDLQSANLNNVFGVCTTSINGRRFNAYWLFIPNVSCWIYNIDESNWTRFTYAATPSRADFFSNNGVIRIIDLVGSIASQQWTPATLQSNNPLDNFLVGFTNSNVGMIDFTSFSEQPWSMTLPQMVMGDQRHEKTVNAVRLVFQDLGVAQFSLSVSNEKGDVRTPLVPGTTNSANPISIGSGTGKMSTVIIGFPQITGMYIQPTISGVAAQPFSMSELTPIYVPGAEYKVNVLP